MREPHFIEHDPEEPKIDRGPGPWKIVLPLIAIFWVGNLYYFPIDWRSVALGLMTGGGIVAWAIDITGNKVPDWWKSKPPGAGRS